MKLKKEFTKKLAKDIAEKSFGHTLDCVLGYSDTGYSLADDVAIFDQNFEEDLEEAGITVTERRIKVIQNCYVDLVKKFESMVRKKYYDKWDEKSKK